MQPQLNLICNPKYFQLYEIIEIHMNNTGNGAKSTSSFPMYEYGLASVEKQ